MRIEMRGGGWANPFARIKLVLWDRARQDNWCKECSDLKVASQYKSANITGEVGAFGAGLGRVKSPFSRLPEICLTLYPAFPCVFSLGSDFSGFMTVTCSTEALPCSAKDSCVFF